MCLTFVQKINTIHVGVILGCVVIKNAIEFWTHFSHEMDAGLIRVKSSSIMFD